MRNTKKLLLILLVVSLMGIISWGIRFTYSNTVHFPGDAAVTVHWTSIYDDINESFTQILSLEEAAAVVRIFNGYRYEVLGDGAGCPLNERQTVTIGDAVFYLGQDACQVIEHAQTGRIFEMRNDDWSALDRIFQKYGGKLSEDIWKSDDSRQRRGGYENT